METEREEWVLYEDKTNIKKYIEYLENKIDKMIINTDTKLDIINKQNEKIIKQNEHILKSINDRKNKVNIDIEQIRSYNRNWRGSYLHGGLLPFAYNYGCNANA